jgi:hypothetical protein
MASAQLAVNSQSRQRNALPIGHLSLEDTKLRVLSVSGVRPGLTPRELQKALGSRVKPSVLVRAIFELAKENRIGLLRQADWIETF